MASAAESPPFLLFVALLAATGVMRSIELAVSLGRLRARAGEPVNEGWLFPLMALVHTALVLAPPVEVLALDRPFVPWLGAASGCVLLLATALRVWTLCTLGAAWNVRVVRPAERAIATRGPYAWIRHPNYLAVILEVAALPLLHTAWIAGLALSAANGCVLWRRIRNEERALAASPAWRAAMAERARLIPGLF